MKLFLWMIWMLQTSLDAADYFDKPIVDVQMITAPGEQVSQLMLLVDDLTPGSLLKRENLEEGVKRLYSLGRFSQVQVKASLLEGSVRLVFVLQAQQRLAKIEVKGFRPPSEVVFLQKLAINPGDEIYQNTSALLLEKAKNYFTQKGFPNNNISLDWIADHRPHELKAVFHVESGEPIRIRSISLLGEPRLPKTLLRPYFSLWQGDVLDLDKLSHLRDDLLENYYKRGFLLANVALPVYEMVGPNTADVLLEITAGPRVFLNIKGNHLFSAEQLKDFWPDQAGGLQKNTLSLWQRNILKQYVRHGYYHAQMHVEVNDSNSYEQWLNVVIDEGLAVVVSDVKFIDNSAFPDAILQQQISALLLKELGPDILFQSLRDNEKNTSFPWEEDPQVLTRVPIEKRYVPYLYEEAIEQIELGYQNIGYLKAKVGPLKSYENCDHRFHRCDMEIRIPIHAGAQSFIESIAFQGAQKTIDTNRLLKVLKDATSFDPLTGPLMPGAPLSYSYLDDGRIALLRFLKNEGFIYSRVSLEVEEIANTEDVKVLYGIDLGPRVSVRNILITGQEYTKTSIIQNRMQLKIKDIYKPDHAKMDERSIGRLNVFNEVSVDLLDEQNVSDKKDVVVKLKERMRQSIEIAPGISTVEGPRLRIGYSLLNVLGTASTMSLSLRLNRQIFFSSWFLGNAASILEKRIGSYVGWQQLTDALERIVRLGLRSPPLKIGLFDPVFRADLTNQRLNIVNYSKESTGLIVGVDGAMSYMGGPGLRMTLESQLTFANITLCSGVDCPSQDNPIYAGQSRFQPLPGSRLIYKVGPQLSWEQRDNPLSPSRGYYLSTNLTQAWGYQEKSAIHAAESIRFTKLELQTTGYIPSSVVSLASSMRFGHFFWVASDYIPVEERFFLGGRDTLRGFAEGQLFPQDTCIEAGRGCHSLLTPNTRDVYVSPGGNSFFLWKNELRWHLTDNMTFDIFADIGNLWLQLPPLDKWHLRLGTGLGLRYSTPFSALSLDLGFNPWQRLDLKEPLFLLHFSMGAF